MDGEFDKLIEAIAADGKITSKERDVLYRAADKHGIERDMANVMMNAALHKAKARSAEDQNAAKGRAKRQRGGVEGGGRIISACPRCGAPAEPIMSNCMFCRSPIGGAGEDDLSDQDLIRRAGLWVGRIGDGSVLLKAADANQFTGRGMRAVHRGEIVGIARSYLSILEARGEKSAVLRPIAERLRYEFDEQMRPGRAIRPWLPLLSMSVVLVALIAGGIYLGARNDSRKVEAAIAALDAIEEQIADSITNGDLDRARFLLIRLDWPEGAATDVTNAKYQKMYAARKQQYSALIDSSASANR